VDRRIGNVGATIVPVMRFALGLVVHTGWAAAAVAGGDWDEPVLVARERLELLGEGARFVFHRAAEMSSRDAEAWVTRARKEATGRASALLQGLRSKHAVKECGIVAKAGAMLALEDIVAAHPRIHTAEGGFYRDVLKEAAEAAGMRARVISPANLDGKDARLAAVGKVVGRPWSLDWKLAVMAAWRCLSP
jgi:hypothetical protein